jgi:5-methylcytosine-specific restriction endonuclease McrA
VSCNTERVANHRIKKKKILIEEMGGSCIICGYKKYIGSLHFHHINPSDKKSNLSRMNLALNIDKLREEAKKCILVCSNCHSEIHAGYYPQYLFEQGGCHDSNQTGQKRNA